MRSHKPENLQRLTSGRIQFDVIYLAGPPAGAPGTSGIMGATGLLPSARRRCINTPTPSKTPRRIPHMTPAPNAVLGPPRMAKLEPVKKPAIMAFHGSSFWRTDLTVQSKDVKRPPQTPKLPPRTGARALIADTDPRKRSPRGELRAPLIPCQIVPPMQPMAKAPPKSLRITHGQGSRE